MDLGQAEEDGLGALASPAWLAALAHILESVFSGRFSVFLKLHWAVSSGNHYGAQISILS